MERRAHAGQLIRYRGGDARDFDEETAESPALGRAAARETFKKMREGRFATFAIKGESPSNLRVAEILKEEEEFVNIWYYADRTLINYDNARADAGIAASSARKVR